MTELKAVITYDVQCLEDLGWEDVFIVPHEDLSEATLAYENEVKYDLKSIFRLVEVRTKKRVINKSKEKR